VPSSDTERSYVPVADPADRPRKSRATVRVIMIDNDRTLLFHDSDPGVPDTSWWTTPGGGVDEGESEVHAAIREVAEETGYQLTEPELLGPIAVRHVVHGYSDLVIEQDESFFLAMVQPFEVDIAAHTPD
jgi:8-oxo-dGTP pyrophosphatase MutT (NUDIX family)